MASAASIEVTDDEGKSEDDPRYYSDALSEYLCTPCKFDDETVSAEHYCLDCDKYFCVTCLKYHKRFSNCAGLNVLGKSEVHRWGVQTKKVKPMCGKHPEKELEMFCGNHDIVCCHVCVSLEHRSCSNIAYIPDVAKDIQNNGELEALKNKTAKVIADVDALEAVKVQGKITLDQSKDEYSRSINCFRDKYSAILNNLTDKTIKEMDQFYVTHENVLKVDIKDLKEIRGSMSRIKELSINTMDGSDTFIHIKESKRKVREADKVISDMSCQKSVKYKFTIDGKLEKFLTAVSNLDPNLDQYLVGSKNIGQPIPELKKGLDRMEDLSKIAMKHLWESSNYRHTNGLCSLRGKDGILITQNKHPGYSEKGFISHLLLKEGVAEDGKVSISVRSQGRLKEENEDADVPIALCLITDNDIATTLSNKTVVIFSFKLNATFSKTMSFDHDCFGIAYHNDILYISSQEGDVYMYDLGQTCIKQIQKGPDGKRCFVKAQHMAISPDKTKLYVTDWFKGLITLDMSGRVLSQFSHPALAGACDVTTDNEGHVFVCGYNSRNVVQVDNSGEQLVKVAITEMSTSPTTITFISTLSCMAVGSYDRLLIYKVENKTIKV